MADGSDGDGRGLVKRFRRAEKVDGAFDVGVTSDVQLEKDSARWVELAGAGSQLAPAAATGDLSKFVDQASYLVGALLEVQDVAGATPPVDRRERQIALSWSRSRTAACNWTQHVD